MTVIHADINSFYASAEQLFRPDLKGKPVMVLSNNDGCVVALNKEAKARGFKRGDVYFQVREKAERSKVAVFSSNYTLYADISRRVNDLYMEMSGGDIEPYSIDESFLFMPDLKEQALIDICRELKEKVFRETGMPICVGAASTKTLAKLYNKKAKEHKGVYVCTKDNLDGELKRTDCATIWGIGAQYAKRLELEGILNAYQIKQMSLYEANKKFGVNMVAIVQELNGKASKLKVEKYKRDTMASSRMFGRRVKTLRELECAASQYTELCCEKLLDQKSECGAVTVYITTGLPYAENASTVYTYSNSRTIRLARRTCSLTVLNEAAQTALRQIFRDGYGYHSLMVCLGDLADIGGQKELFDDENKIKNEIALMDVWRKCNSRWGRGTVTLAASGTAEGWAMKREHLSPQYTTDVRDAVCV